MHSSRWERGEAARTALLSPSRPLVTQLLIAANILWFLAGGVVAVRDNIPISDYLFPGAGIGRVLEQIGAVSGRTVYLEHQWWRLLTCIFVHIGLIHLGVNMYSLHLVGPLLEQLWGPWRFLVLYLLTGICGSCGMLIDNPVGGGAGASGALWGVMGSMATWLILNRHVLPRSLVSSWQRQLWLTLILNLFITFGIAGISKGAHLGGGIVGLIAAVPMDILRFGTRRQRVMAAVALALIPAVCLVGMIRYLDRKGQAIRVVERQRENAELWHDHILPLRQVTEDIPNLLQGQAEPLLERAPDTRGAAEVNAVIQALASKKEELEKLRSALDNAGPYWSLDVEKERRRCRSLVQETMQLLDAVQDCLRQNEAWTQKRLFDEVVFNLIVFNRQIPFQQPE
jgi:rhomboid protease GluP